MQIALAKASQAIAKQCLRPNFWSAEKTKPNQVATNFGSPAEMITLKSAAGEANGVVWVYHNAVLTQKSLRDARFVLINGEMKYVTLSSAVSLEKISLALNFPFVRVSGHFFASN